MPFLTAVYIVISACLALYGLNSFVIAVVRLRYRQTDPSCSVQSGFPLVTVQLPIYNEKYVVERAIDSIAGLQWPRDRLQIQVLDDSTDETTEIARQRAAYYQGRGTAIEVIHRADRSGYKAGALNSAMQAARGEFVAIFDADFCPSPDFLEQTIPFIEAEPRLGFLQTRWGHLNDEYSALTLAQAVALDGHFCVEHIAREKAGWLTNFSGTGGVWRRSCIQACGGWDPTVLTEDIELSYRAQLAGWKGLTLQNVTASAELPVQLVAFLQQQFRWAKGNTQSFIKLAPAILCADLPWMTRLQGLLHTSTYAAHPLMLVVMCLSLPILWFGSLDSWALAILSLATLGPLTVYVLGQAELYPNWLHRLRALPVLICLGTGLAFNSTVAVLEAILHIKSAFARTPKYRIEGRTGNWQTQSYARSNPRRFWGEALAALYAALTVIAAAQVGKWQAIPFLLLYVFGFGYVYVTGKSQRRRTHAPERD